jgi:hypothetical protein
MKMNRMVFMLDLKKFVNVAKTRKVTNEDRKPFLTIGFDPEELIQLKNLDHNELLGLMMFCGIRVYDGMPLCVLEDDEMRMAYVIWRAEMIKQKTKEILPEVRRGIKWIDYLRKAAQIVSQY